MTATAEQETPFERGRRHIFSGVVISDKMNKTRVVNVERRVKHSFYEKVMTKHSRFYVHDEGNESHAGDLVEIMGARPLSRLKRWRLVRIVKAAPRAAQAAGTGKASQKEKAPHVAEAKTAPK